MKKRNLVFALLLVFSIGVLQAQLDTIMVNGVSFCMVEVDGGSFMMGCASKRSKNCSRDEKPLHSVMLNDYYIGETEVTQELWETVMGYNPSHFVGKDRPVEQVSWEDAQDFIAKLNKLTGKIFRLPTEAEWEFAAKGGTKTQGYKYSGSNKIKKVACFVKTSNRESASVKSRKPNELGIYDMSGNVKEWCSDWKAPYSSSEEKNPTGAEVGTLRILRGGGWINDDKDCRVINRDGGKPEFSYRSCGFRLAMSR